MKILRKTKKSAEFYVLITVIALCVFIQVRSGLFFTSVNIVDLLRAYIVPGIMACGVLLVMVSGGIDVSFPAIATLSIFLSITLFEDYTGSAVLPCVVSIAIGALLGMINGVIIAKCRLPALIVTLGTSSVFWGVLHGVFKASEIAILPEGIGRLSKTTMLTVYDEQLGIGSELPIMFIALVAVVVIVWFILNRTMIGRGIYALGGDINAAERVGFNVFWINVFIYMFMGAIAGAAGFTRTVIMSSFHPNAMFGVEMNIIAMVVLGGARLTGGIGTVKGTLLGMILITTMSNSLQLLGIPIYWQKIFTGAIILIGIGVSAYQVVRQKRNLTSVVLENQ